MVHISTVAEFVSVEAHQGWVVLSFPLVHVRICLRLCWHGHTMAAVTLVVISDLVQEHFELKTRSLCSLSLKESFCSQKRNTFIKLFCRLDNWGRFTVLLRRVVAPVSVEWKFGGVRQSGSAYPHVNMRIGKVNVHLVDYTLLVNLQ